ncbi:hypothetical protein ACO0LB_17990 [Undibacterium sp. SXout7W]|uniref:hypothetical protein n=1 Tax=Undibacterium sp. SXout7W TaxID=3413049 RepID=UPI003BF21CA9
MLLITLIDGFLLMAGFLSMLNSDFSPIHRPACPAFLRLLLVKENSVLYVALDALYPWHKIRAPIGKTWSQFTVTEKLKIRWQLHNLKPYVWIWYAIGLCISLAAHSPAFCLVQTFYICVAYSKRPK